VAVTSLNRPELPARACDDSTRAALRTDVVRLRKQS
jgi:hypothetical protein